jgi:hypothetical protein
VTLEDWHHTCLYLVLKAISVQILDIIGYWTCKPGKERLLMIERDTIVTYRDLRLEIAGHCGVVEDRVEDQPDYVWVRWVGDTSKCKEYIPDLKII